MKRLLAIGFTFGLGIIAFAPAPTEAGHQVGELSCESPTGITTPFINCFEGPPSPCGDVEQPFGLLSDLFNIFPGEIRDPRCPTPTPGGVSCVAMGVYLNASPYLTGPVEAKDVQSRSTAETPGGVAASSAALHDVSTGPGFVTHSGTVTSDCAVEADPARHGRAHAAVEDLTIDLSTLLGPTAVFNADVVEETLDVTAGTPAWTCVKAVANHVNVPSSLSQHFCPAPNYTIHLGLGSGSGLEATIRFDERTGPIVNSAGQQVWTGAALHVTVEDPAVLGTSLLDLYVDYVAVAM